tara:strand:+ start:3858 stop:5753 length:1896 start_codon:yes stop_codon:yes gene_type:complete
MKNNFTAVKIALSLLLLLVGDEYRSQYVASTCQSTNEALIGIDRNDWAHNNLEVVNEGYLHNFIPPELPCGLENAQITSVVANIEIISINNSTNCNGVPIFGNVLLNCVLSTSSICPIEQDVLSAGCAFGQGVTTTGNYSLNLSGCGVNPNVSSIIGVDIIPATEILASCPSNGAAISQGLISIQYTICLDYTYNMNGPVACASSIVLPCNDGDDCTLNDIMTVDECDNSIVCVPCAGNVAADCNDTAVILCDDGNPCTVDDQETVSACDNTFVCIPCGGTFQADCNDTISLPCDDGNSCTENDLETVSACDNDIICIPCAGVVTPTCDNVIILPCDDNDSCTVNDEVTVAVCDNSFICIPCAGNVAADCTNTIELACDDGLLCTIDDMVIVSACDTDLVCIPCSGVQVIQCDLTTSLPCDDGDPCTENDVEIIDACFNSDICIPCTGTPIFPDVCNDFDCTNGIEFWNNELCECDVELTILGCTDVNSCNYDSEANCDSECDYSCLDCRGVPFGTWAEDNCGICLSPEDEIRDLTCLAGPFIPNSFTPNNDGVNDYFNVSTARPFAHFEIIILDKWGNVVFTSDDSEFRWLGNKNNGNYYLPPDIYSYKFSYRFENTSTETIFAHVALIR